MDDLLDLLPPDLTFDLDPDKNGVPRRDPADLATAIRPGGRPVRAGVPEHLRDVLLLPGRGRGLHGGARPRRARGTRRRRARPDRPRLARGTDRPAREADLAEAAALLRRPPAPGCAADAPVGEAGTSTLTSLARAIAVARGPRSPAAPSATSTSASVRWSSSRWRWPARPTPRWPPWSAMTRSAGRLLVVPSPRPGPAFRLRRRSGRHASSLTSAATCRPGGARQRGQRRRSRTPTRRSSWCPTRPAWPSPGCSAAPPASAATEGECAVAGSVPVLGRWLTYFTERAEHPCLIPHALRDRGTGRALGDRAGPRSRTRTWRRCSPGSTRRPA